MNTEEKHELIAPLLPAYEMNLLEAGERAETEVHVRQCNDCFETLYRFAPVSAALRRRKEAKVKKRVVAIATPKWQWLMTAVMGLLLIIAFWIFWKSSSLQKELMRGAAQIQLLDPSNDRDIASPVVFRWEEEPEASFYKIYIFRKEVMLVAGERVESPFYNWNASGSVEKGRYNWKVESYFSDGTLIRDSVTNEFHLKR